MAKPKKPESLKAKAERIRFLFHLAESLCDKQRGGNALRESVAIASRQERQHRALGRRMVGAIRARCSVETCAKLFALRGFVTPKRQRSFGARADFVSAFGAAEACQASCERTHSAEYLDFCRAYRKAIQAIDYRALVEGDK
jgi:hypothetical protein